MEEDLQTGFVRQRRNLIVMSLLLAFVQFHPVAPIQELKIFDAPFDFGDRPVEVHFYLWLIYGWWLYRYYVYFQDSTAIAFQAKVRNRLVPVVLRALRKQFGPESPWRNEAQEKFYSVELDKREKLPNLDRVDTEASAWSMEGLEITGPFYWRRIVSTVQFWIVKPDKTIDTRANTSLTIVLDGWPAFLANLRVRSNILFNTRIFSEYLAPFGFALLPVGIWICRRFVG